ncbi:hypothetical protein H7698_03105 [Pseudomonas sp. p50]|jgi:hypothetical protein|uniref:hypothetical protein n=1 Tax=Pseudomonas sp. p50(2008) TaxID=2816832 RepID=UPI00188D919D|nr:hypothetical protein [Pseudomonas sp. p50(2008)]MBF4555045.1 hypothetical protein [Pseudomonas sp. p50(2008)]
MKTIEISIIVNEKLEKALIMRDRKNRELTFLMEDNLSKTYKEEDIYECFGLLRADFPDIKFLCKGAKINVHTSRMSSQMSAGVLAYEIELGKPTDDEDIVNIFDYEDTDITNNIEEQRKFYKKWIKSLSK